MRHNYNFLFVKVATRRLRNSLQATKSHRLCRCLSFPLRSYCSLFNIPRILDALHHISPRVWTRLFPVYRVQQGTELGIKLHLLYLFDAWCDELLRDQCLQSFCSCIIILSLWMSQVGIIFWAIHAQLHGYCLNIIRRKELILENGWEVLVQLPTHAVPIMEVIWCDSHYNHFVALIEDSDEIIKGLNVLPAVESFQGVEKVVARVLCMALDEEEYCDVGEESFLH